jgi:CubicO group peptidase (beta-lactamase class C family)
MKLIKNFLIAAILLGCNTTFSQSLEQKVDEYITPLVEASDFYGSVLFAKDGKIELAKGYGYADLEHDVLNTPTSVYHMGSLNKPITAIGVMLLHQNGVVDINKTIDQYLPSYPRGDEIRMIDLLAQTSGIPSYNSFPDYNDYSNRENTLQEVVDWFKKEELLFEPGTKYEYSNCNFVLLAHIIEQVSRKSYEVYMNMNIFEPLGMEKTGLFKYDEIVKNRAIGYDPANNKYGLKPIGFYNNSIKVGSGAVHSTVVDMLKLESALYTDKILNKETRDLMLTEPADNEYGLGWGIWKRFDKKKYDHDGASPGAVAYFSTYPDDKVTIIFLGNINSGVFNAMKKDLAAIYFNEEYTIPAPRKYMEIEESKLSKFEGRYEFDNGNFFDLKVIKDDLRFLWRGRGELGYLLSPLNDYSFYMRARGDQINFKIDENGHLSTTYLERSGESKLKKIK